MMCPLEGTEILHDMGDRGDGVVDVKVPQSVIDEIINKKLVGGSLGVRMREAKLQGYTADEVAAALKFWKDTHAEIKNKEQGREYLLHYRQVVESMKNFIGDWPALKDKIFEFEKSKPLTVLLPIEVQHFADHDGDKLRADLGTLCVKIMERCDRLMQKEYLLENEEKNAGAEIRDLLNTMKMVWRLYESVMRDILLRIESKTEVPVADRDGEFTMIDILGPIAVHSEHLSKYYQSLDNKKKSIGFELGGLGERIVCVNQDVIINIVNNVINNAFYFARSEIKLELAESADGDNLIIRISNDGVPIDMSINEMGARKGRLQIYNERFTTKDTRGLGIADADTRLESMGAEIKVVNHQRIRDKEFNGFEIVVSLKRK